MTVTKSALLMSALILTSLPFSAQAEEAMTMDHSKMAMPKVDMTVVDAYAPSMEKMHKDMMDVKPTGDVDVDFVRGMIPHHQGAIDMAKVVLEKGKDPVIRNLAENISRAQVSEIKLMKDWLKDHDEKEKAAAKAAAEKAPKTAPKK